MSNVLIGIIGVILFIGLALAGALFLGPRFQESANNSKASASVAALNQYAEAIHLRNLSIGRGTSNAETTQLKTEGYLKDFPANPVSGATDIWMAQWDGKQTGGGVVTHVFMPIPYAKLEVCRAIARQSGQPTVETANPGGVSAVPASPTGCFRTNVPWGDVPVGQYMAYSKI